MVYRGPYLDGCRELGDRIVDGYAWIINKQDNGTTFLICKDRTKKQCMATARIDEDNNMTTRRVHSHGPNRTLEIISVFVEALHDITVRSLQPVRKIYDTIKILHAEAVRHVSYEKIKYSMRRWRASEERPEPISYSNLQEMLESDDYAYFRDNEFGTIRTACLPVGDDKVTVVMGHARFAVPIYINTLYISTTTRVLPSLNNTQQMLFVIAAYENHVPTKLPLQKCIGIASDDLRAFPFAWALIEDSDSDTYAAILRFVRYEICTGVRNYLTDVYTDLDINLREVVTSKFYDTTVHITFHDFCRVMFSYVGETINLDNDDHAIIFKKFLSLTLLPPDKIEDAFAWLVNSMTPELNIAFRDLATAFLNVFIEGLGLETLSFYEKSKAFEDVGQMHAQLLLNKVGRDPSAWKFIGGVHKILEATWKNSVRLTENPNHSISTTPRIRTSIPVHKLWTLWTNYDTQNLTPSRFLATASFLMTEYFEDLKFQRETTVSRVVDRIRELPGEAVPNVEDLLREDDSDELPIQIPDHEIMPENVEDFPVFDYGPLPANPNEIPAPQFFQGVDPYNWACQMCKTRRVNEISLPCNHVAVCTDCAETLRRNITPNAPLCCPQCKEVANIQKAYLPIDEGGDWKCQVCNDAPLEIIIKPCFHIMICDQCSNAIQESARIRAVTKRCPFCNTVANSFEHALIQRG